MKRVLALQEALNAAKENHRLYCRLNGGPYNVHPVGATFWSDVDEHLAVAHPSQRLTGYAIRHGDGPLRLTTFYLSFRTKARRSTGN